MAGLGEACSHIGAVLFYLEVVVKHRDARACTEKDNMWLPAYCNNLECVPISKVDFSSATAKKRRIDEAQLSHLQALRSPKPAASRPDDQQWAQFLADVSSAGTKPAFLSLVDDYAEQYEPTASKYKTAVLSNMCKKGVQPSWDIILKECEKVASGIHIEPNVSIRVQCLMMKKWCRQDGEILI